MGSRLLHRGPDADGEFLDEDAGLGLGHRRLSILDLSPEGRQPMVSTCGRYVIAYNGEIYNYRQLRQELERSAPRAFRGSSDTEVLLEAIAAWGLNTALQRCIGMFALALWDRDERRLRLVRDRLGIKPLYYSDTGKGWIFASELRALHAHPDFRPELSADALLAYLRHSAVPAPGAIYSGVHKLLPGQIVTLSGPRSSAEATSFWDARERWLSAIQERVPESTGDAVEELEALLLDAVRLRMIADVPLGAFLSGGIDSSLVVALMQRSSRRPVKTFTIGFHDARYDEAPFARRIAEHLGTDHTELYVSGDDALAVVPKLAELSDEPLGDSSFIPTFLVSQLARQSVTVALSGDGGDELFGGYSHYRTLPTLWRRSGWLPPGLKRAAGRGGGALATSLREALPQGRFSFAERQCERVAYVSSLLAASADPIDLYWRQFRHWNHDPGVVPGARPLPTRYDELRDRLETSGSFAERMMLADLLLYLPDVLLTKVDRASMAVSLEARVPLLDHRVVELAWRIPVEQRVAERAGKLPLRALLARHVPPDLFERRKQGFSVPLARWLRHDLREWAESLLTRQRLLDAGLCPAAVERRWRQHQQGLVNWQNELWNVIMFQAWRIEQERPAS